MKIKKTITAPRVEMLPLIDIIFLLLVFFIYAMLSMAVHHGKAIDLPDSDSVSLETKEAISIIIQAKDDGVAVFLDDGEAPLALEELRVSLEERKQQHSDDDEPDVQIFADKTVSYQGLFQVLDTVSKVGLTRISLQADPKP
jgi:biopolymer transport protein ExbD